jgi:4-hydroxythreonine-4-phosphate dehydrogenase
MAASSATSSSDNRPTLAVTMGDPAGIGPEVVAKVLADAEVRHRARLVVYGLNEHLAYAADKAELDPAWWRVAADGQTRRHGRDCVVVDYDAFDLLGHGPRPSREGGRASVRFCLDALAAAKAGTVDGIVTAPISKQSWNMAGYNWPGHTELFAERTNTKHVAMMFAGGPLRVALATVHIGLNALWSRLRIGTVYNAIELLHDGLVEWFDLPTPRIAVCGVNPHAGEGGLFGDEEERLIKPAIEAAVNNGIDARGPFAADTVFVRQLKGEFDAVVAMYHDQGLIPAKLLGDGRSVNLTLGLPIVRTSPDHGTAFDIAGQNKADPRSMKSAILMAADLAERRRNKARTAAATA